MKFTFSLLFCSFFLFSCQNNPTEIASYGNPSADGFNTKGSDNQAIAVADKVMEAMGGRRAWDETEHLQWNFFGRRKHTWNKNTGDIKIESLPDSITYLLNIYSNEGQVKRKEEIISHPDTLKTFLKNGKSMWINDAYWLVMPFKLKDSGVTLKYLGADTLQTGEDAEVLSLTFENVGDTPQNKYHVFVDKSDNLIKQWSFYSEASDLEPRFVTPWVDYKKYGNILLSDNRGRGQLTEIAVLDSLPNNFYKEF